MFTTGLEYFEGDISTFLLAQLVTSTQMIFQRFLCALETSQQLSKAGASAFRPTCQLWRGVFPQHVSPALRPSHSPPTFYLTPLSACSSGHSGRAWGALETFLLVPALLPDGDGHCPALSRNLQTCELHILELASLHPATYQLPLAASAEAAQLLSEK